MSQSMCPYNEVIERLSSDVEKPQSTVAWHDIRVLRICDPSTTGPSDHARRETLHRIN